MNTDINDQNQNKVEIALGAIKQLIIDKLTELELEENLLVKVKSENIFDIPSDSLHGDYTTNVAMMCARELRMNPIDLASKLVEVLIANPEIYIGINSVIIMTAYEIAKPGFINIKLSNDLVRSAFENVGNVKNEFTSKNVLVEHSSPNLFKPFSVGHLMNNIIGEATQRLAVAFGSKVETMSFPSDISLGIAKAMMIVESDLKEEKIYIDFFMQGDESYKIKYLGDAYVKGVKLCEEDNKYLDYAKDMLDRMYKRHLKDESLLQLLYLTRNINEKYFKSVLQSIGSDIKHYIYESTSGQVGSLIVKENTGTGKVFNESDGAIIYTPDENRKDIHTAVFINSQGYPTYEAKDIGLIYIKFNLLSEIGIKDFFPDFSFTLTDAEQTNHFKVVLDAASKLGSDWQGMVKKTHHIPHGRMMFRGQKMSSRLGGVPLALDVIEVVKDEAREIFERNKKLEGKDEKEKGKIAFEIAMSALRIAVLRAKPGININFDPETSLSFEGDSGPYLLYTHARCSSLIDKGWEKFGSDMDIETFVNELEFDSNKSINELESNLLHYNDALMSCVKFDNGEVSVEPQKLVSYLFKVAREFNSFYGNTQIISNNEKLTKHNLKIVLWTKEIMRHGLHILGIEAQERM